MSAGELGSLSRLDLRLHANGHEIKRPEVEKRSLHGRIGPEGDPPGARPAA